MFGLARPSSSPAQISGRLLDAAQDFHSGMSRRAPERADSFQRNVLTPMHDAARSGDHERLATFARGAAAVAERTLLAMAVAVPIAEELIEEIEMA